jgi:hypothetical protein
MKKVRNLSLIGLMVIGTQAFASATVTFSNTTSHDLTFMSQNDRNSNHFVCLKNRDGEAFKREYVARLHEYYDYFIIPANTVKTFNFDKTKYHCNDFKNSEAVVYSTQIAKEESKASGRIMLYQSNLHMTGSSNPYENNVIYQSHFKISEVLFTLTQKKKSLF